MAFDAAEPRQLAAFWRSVTGYVTEFESAEVMRLKAPDERGVRGMVFWRVPEPKTTKTRVHVDLATRDRAAMIERPNEARGLTGR